MKYILQHYSKYPQMQLQDFVKLLYQANFGCEHIFSDKMVGYIDSEMQQCQCSSAPLFEQISDEYCRVDLSAYKALGGTSQTLGKCMRNVHASGTKQHLCNQLDQLLLLIKDGTIGLDYHQAVEQIEWYKQQDCPAIHHSQQYRDSYHPHYRVVYTKQAMLLRAMVQIEGNLAQGKPIVVGMDGPCGSGKSTLAQVLSQHLSCPIIHADHFFLPPELRTMQRIQAGQNLHWEALLPVIEKAKQCKDFVYQVYNCQTNSYLDKQFNAASCTIVEGSYSLVEPLRHLYDVTILLQIDADKQLQRLTKRQGNIEQFVNKWIVYEQYHLDKLPPCDIVIDTNVEAL